MAAEAAAAAAEEVGAAAGAEAAAGATTTTMAATCRCPRCSSLPGRSRWGRREEEQEEAALE